MCPGYLVRLPAVIEGVEAYAAREDGMLHLFDPFELNVVWEMAATAKRAFNLYQQEKQRQTAARLGK